MSIKTVYAVISVIIGTCSFFPYLRDIFLKKTKPHSYTWLIWTITQGTAMAGIWYGGGGLGALELTIGTMLVFAIFLFSLRYGTKNITKSDGVILLLALFAIFVWWQLKNPILAVLMACAIDTLGYVPSFRKSFHEPWSETLVAYTGFCIGNGFALLALREYNILTMSYLISISMANILLIGICLVRRETVTRPKIHN